MTSKNFVAVLGLCEDPTEYLKGIPPAVRRAMFRDMPPGATDVRGLRGYLLRKFRPRFANVYARHVTLGYNVSRNFPLPSTPVAVTLVGEIVKDGTQALVAMVDGKIGRYDGKIFHLTVSTDYGVPPAAAGDFSVVDPAIRWFDSTELEEVTLSAYFIPMWKVEAQPNRWAA